NEPLVAPEAVHADEITIPPRDLDRLLEVLEGEGDRVPEAVISLREPLREALVRQVALDAGGGVPVPALEPGIVLRVHDVAVHAGPGIRREVREAFRVDEREGSDADRDPDQAHESNGQARPGHEFPVGARVTPSASPTSGPASRCAAPSIPGRSSPRSPPARWRVARRPTG